jgi:hypothetical protein
VVLDSAKQSAPLPFAPFVVLLRFNTDAEEPSNRLSARKPLKQKKVSNRIMQHARQNDEA